MSDTMTPTFTIGDRLRKAREFVGLGTSEMADELGVSRATIQRAERAQHVPRRTLLAWAMRTGVPVEWLETGEVDELPTGRYGGLAA